MRTLDETDREILRLLLEDARRPFSDIADRVDLSAPAVSDRVDRLREMGVVEGFTVRLDRTTVREGLELLVTIRVGLADVDAARDGLAELEHVDHVFTTADGRITFSVVVREDDVRALIDDAVGLDVVDDVDVRVVTDRDWTPSLGDARLAIDCVECGNSVTSEGETAEVDGTRYHFCCGSCRANFEARYDRLEEGT